MKQRLKLVGFVLIAIGSPGLLIEEFAFDGGGTGWRTVATMLLAAVSLTGFATLAFAHWRLE